MGEPAGERLGQAGRPDLRLRSLERVGRPAEGGTAGVEVEQEPGRPRVAAARLADRARVDEPARGREVDLIAGVREPAGEVDAVVADLEGDVAVADEDEGRVRRSRGSPARPPR